MTTRIVGGAELDRCKNLEFNIAPVDVSVLQWRVIALIGGRGGNKERHHADIPERKQVTTPMRKLLAPRRNVLLPLQRHPGREKGGTSLACTVCNYKS